MSKKPRPSQGEAAARAATTSACFKSLFPPGIFTNIRKAYSKSPIIHKNHDAGMTQTSL